MSIDVKQVMTEQGTILNAERVIYRFISGHAEPIVQCRLVLTAIDGPCEIEIQTDRDKWVKVNLKKGQRAALDF